MICKGILSGLSTHIAVTILIPGILIERQCDEGTKMPPALRVGNTFVLFQPCSAWLKQRYRIHVAHREMKPINMTAAHPTTVAK